MCGPYPVTTALLPLLRAEPSFPPAHLRPHLPICFSKEKINLQGAAEKHLLGKNFIVFPSFPIRESPLLFSQSSHNLQMPLRLLPQQPSFCLTLTQNSQIKINENNLRVSVCSALPVPKFCDSNHIIYLIWWLFFNYIIFHPFCEWSHNQSPSTFNFLPPLVCLFPCWTVLQVRLKVHHAQAFNLLSVRQNRTQSFLHDALVRQPIIQTYLLLCHFARNKG